ncbi:MAG TPA: exosortase E/protease, VPEID-CTERM system [Hyphomicrobium sp.]
MRALTAAEFGKSDRTRRLLAFAALSLGEILLISYSFNFATGLPEWMNPVAYAKGAAQAGLLALIAFLVIVWPQRPAITRAWNEAARARKWRASVLINLALFAVVLAATIAFSNLAAHAASPPWRWFALYCCLLLATAASLGAIAAPLSFWQWLVRAAPTQIGVALLSACLLVLAGRLSLESWSTLSGATLYVSHWILTLYESDVVVDASRQLLGAGDFKVLVLKECSGYEGIGLVVAFLALYSWLMRRSLRYPHALLLFPLAIAVVWTLNALRIALLVSIGRHVSPEIAINGFHSQAGWIGFLAVGIGISAASSRIAYFSPHAASKPRSQSAPSDRLQLALLVPFMALMATSIVASLFTPHDQWLYVLKVAAVGTALWCFRDVYASITSAVSPLSMAMGVAVGAVWIATAPNDHSGAELAAWLAALPAWAVAAWMACRALGAIVLVPIAEELAFRGYFQRLFIARDFWRVAPGHFTWLSFIATSVLFGLMHQRWLAAALAGAVYGLLLYRTNRLSDAIGAHIATNAVIVAWAIVAGQWALL